MFLCSNSSAVGLWLSRLRKKSRKSFWTISYPPWVINLRGPCRCMRQGARPFHPVLCKTASDHRRLSSSISTPGKAPCDTSRRADPPPSSRRRPLPSPAPPGPPGQGTLLVTEVPFSHVASLWDCGLCPPPPAPGEGSLLAMFVQIQLGQKEAHGPGETQDSASCVQRTIDALLLVPTHHHQSRLRWGRTGEQGRECHSCCRH